MYPTRLRGVEVLCHDCARPVYVMDDPWRTIMRHVAPIPERMLAEFCAELDADHDVTQVTHVTLCPGSDQPARIIL